MESEATESVVAPKLAFCSSNSMENWNRIGDNQIAKFGNRSWQFNCPNGLYTLTVSQSDQDTVIAKFRNDTEYWGIDRKEQKGDEFKLCGHAGWIPELLEDFCWFELLIGPRPKITYWGDRVIYRTDLGLIL